MVDKLANTEANTRRIQFVESCFGTSGQPLLIPGRVLVGEGVLTKICRKKPKPRQFFLFNDILVYGNIVINKKKYNKQHIIPLEEVKIKSLPDEGSLKNGWLISSRTKSFAVYAATGTEKSEWIAHINKCIGDLLAKTGKTAASEHAAPWVPDSEASICMHCKKAQFTLINRRHHCRNCGLVVCGACGSKKFLLPHQSSKPLRVCLTCYDKLISSSSDSMGGSTKFHSNNNANIGVPGTQNTNNLNDDSDSSSTDNDDETNASDDNVLGQNSNTVATYNSFQDTTKNDTSTPKVNLIDGVETPNRSLPPPIPPPPTNTPIKREGNTADETKTQTTVLTENSNIQPPTTIDHLINDDNITSSKTFSNGHTKDLLNDSTENLMGDIAKNSDKENRLSKDLEGVEFSTKLNENLN